jgi:hypothetical protein
MQNEIPAKVERNESDWIQITIGHHKRYRKPVVKQAQLVPASVNCYKLPNNLKELTTVAQNTEQNENTTDNRKDTSKEKARSYHQWRQSCERVCSQILSQAGRNFEVSSFVKPDTGLEVISKMGNKEIGKLTRKDVVVCGGSNDIARNASTEGLRHISNFVENRRHTSIMILNAPHRYDLIAS